MKNLVTLLFLIIAATCGNMASAQYLLNQTSYTPTNFQNYNEPVNINVGNGCTFVGTKYTSTNNGKIISVCYRGSALFPDGGRIITATGGSTLDQNLRFTDGTFYELEPNGELYRVQNQNGQTVSRIRDYRNYIIENNCISFPTATTGGVPSGTYDYSSGSTPNSNSNAATSSGSGTYDRHTATCSGCSGTGNCRRCSGTGVSSTTHKKCSLCHGTGRCQSCAGTGKIHGNF